MTIISRIQRGIAQFLFWWSVQSILQKENLQTSLSFNGMHKTSLQKEGVNDNMETSPTLERMPTLCRCATLPPTNNHLKMESHGNSKAASSAAHWRDISFRGLKSNSSPTAAPATSGMPWYSRVTSCHYMGMNA